MPAVGETALDADDGAEVPTSFVAVTVNVYETPLVSPPTVVVVVVPSTDVVPDGGLEVTEYPVIGLPPSSGACHDTDACPSPAAAVTASGGAGEVALCPYSSAEARPW